MEKKDKEARVLGVFNRISENYDWANHRISLGLQKSWKRMLTDRIIKETEKGGAVLDVCCGTGDIALSVAMARKDLCVTGLDFSPAMLAIAKKKKSAKEAADQYAKKQRKKAALKSRDGLCFVEGNAMALPFADGSFSVACISFGLRNTADYERVLWEMRRVLKPGGMLYCLDSFVPDCPLVLPFYQLYFRYVMPLLGGGRRYREDYLWLYESTQQFLHKSELEVLYRKIGLKKIRHKTKMFGACVLVSGQK